MNLLERIMNIKNILLGVLLLTLTSSFTQLYPQTHLSGGQAYGWMDLSNNLPEVVGLNDVHFVGNEIATLVNEEKPAGEYEIDFSAIGGSASGGNAYNLASGVYIYRMKVNDFITSKKMILLR